MQAYIYKKLMISWEVYQASVTMYLSDVDSQEYKDYQTEMEELKVTLKPKIKYAKTMKKDDRNDQKN